MSTHILIQSSRVQMIFKKGFFSQHIPHKTLRKMVTPASPCSHEETETEQKKNRLVRLKEKQQKKFKSHITDTEVTFSIVC